MINGKRVLAVTLARGGSKSIPKKNIHPLCGKPLIGYTIEQALASRYVDSYAVSTDCEEIASVAQNLGVDHIISRPMELASDTAKSSDALLHALDVMEAEHGRFDFVVELMATNPLKTAEHTDAMLEQIEDSGVDFCVAVQRLYDHHPARIKYIQDGFLKDFYPEEVESRRQDLKPTAYIRAGSIYCMKATALRREAARYDKQSTQAYILPDSCIVNIDEPADLLVAKTLLAERQLET